MTLRLTSAARRDVDELFDWICGEAGLSAAERFVGKLTASLERLAEQPGMGRPRLDWNRGQEEVFTFVIEGRLILYTRREDELLVLRVVHRSISDPTLIGEDA